MTDVFLMCGVLLAGIIGIAYGAYRVGRAFPRISLLFSGLAFCIVVYLWFLIATDKGDGPGQAVGVAMIAFISLFPLIMSAALLAGSLFRTAAMTRGKSK